MREPIQPLQHGFNVSFAKQFPCIFFESTLFDLSGCEVGNRQYFGQYLYHHFGHRGSGRNLGIDREAFEKVLNTLEDFDKSIIASLHGLGCLVILNIKEAHEDKVKETHEEKDADPGKNRFRRGKTVTRTSAQGSAPREVE